MPILLVDRDRRAVAAVHAGWRGTVAEIARRAVEEMQREFGSEPRELEAAIGPGIGACCYEVGPEVGAHFPKNSQFGLNGRARVDLAGANRRQLLEAGLDGARIYISGLCTRCRPDEFHSYRRDKQDAGRMFSFVGLRRGA
jgi:YfiH family protein